MSSVLNWIRAHAIASVVIAFILGLAMGTSRIRSARLRIFSLSWSIRLPKRKRARVLPIGSLAQRVSHGPFRGTGCAVTRGALRASFFRLGSSHAGCANQVPRS